MSICSELVSFTRKTCKNSFWSWSSLAGYFVLLKCLLEWTCLLEHHLDIFFGKLSWYCPKSFIGSDISLPTQWVSGIFNRSTVQIRIMKYCSRFYNQWSYATLLLIQTLQDSALLSIELVAILTMWHHKHKEKSKKQQFCGFQRKDTVLKYPVSFWFFCLTSQILAFENTDGYFLGVAKNALILARNSCFSTALFSLPGLWGPLEN